MVGESPATVAEVVQYNWQAEPWKSIAANFGGAITFGKDIDEQCPGTVTLAFKKNSGTVSIKGQFGTYKATASANLTPVALSEHETMQCYDPTTNRFYTILPDPDAYVLKTVERIDAEFLEDLTAGEVRGL